MPENPWYPFYIGDYQQKTSHLNLMEHGAYNLLLDHYYATRHALPGDRKIIYRICRAGDRYERCAVDSILDQFFVVFNTEIEPNGDRVWVHSVVSSGIFFVHKKCEFEISKMLNYSKSQSANARIRHSKRHVPNGMPNSCQTDARARVPQPQSESKKEIKQSSSEYVSPPVMTTIEDSDSEKVKPSPYHAVEFHKRYNEVREYITLRLPALANKNATEANRWLLDGADPEIDIFPNVDFCIEAARGNISSFKYFTPSITSALKIKNEREEQKQRLRGKYAKPE